MSYVYFIGSQAGPIKVGVSHNPRARLRALQTAHYERLELLGSFLVENAVRFETALHSALDRGRLTGEWFRREVAVHPLEFAWELAGPESQLTEAQQRMCVIVASPLPEGL